MKKNLVCINCPMGCRLDVEIENGKVLSVKGNTCKRGEAYAQQEAVRPMRILTAIMKPKGSKRPFPVRSDRPIPKDMLIMCANEIKKHRPSLPIFDGDVILTDILSTGANIIATSTIEK